MSPLLYGLCRRLFQILAGVQVRTHLGLCQLFFALLFGRFLSSRGALFPALAGKATRQRILECQDASQPLPPLVQGQWEQARRAVLAEAPPHTDHLAQAVSG